MTENHEPPRACAAVPPQPDAPLNPMPPAGPQRAANWLRRVRRGPICNLALLPAGLLWYVIGSFGMDAGFTGVLVFSIVNVMLSTLGLWWFTSPEPDRPKWLRTARWIIRIGVLVTGAAGLVFRGYLGFPYSRPGVAPPATVTVSGAHLILLGAAAWLALTSLHYTIQLAGRLRDNVLRINFKIVRILLAVLLVLGLLTAAREFAASFVPEGGGSKLETAAVAGPHTQPARSDQSPEPPWWAPLIGQAIMAGFLGWGIWLQIRLLRRLTFAARKLDGMSPDGNAPARAGEGG